MSKAAERRIAIRDLHWPEVAEKLWRVRKYDGFTTIPRLLSLICALIKHEAKDDPTSVYVDLWCRGWEEGIVENVDEDDCAFSSGYTGTRARRTWTGHIWELQRLGFIKVAREGNREIAHILLLDPIEICVDRHKKGKADPDWWAAFSRRAHVIGTVLTPKPQGTPSDATVKLKIRPVKPKSAKTGAKQPT